MINFAEVLQQNIYMMSDRPMLFGVSETVHVMKQTVSPVMDRCHKMT